jgi:hypothetical protein
LTPIAIQTCAPPHVCLVGKHAHFHKTDAHGWNWNPYESWGRLGSAPLSDRGRHGSDPMRRFPSVFFGKMANAVKRGGPAGTTVTIPSAFGNLAVSEVTAIKYSPFGSSYRPHPRPLSRRTGEGRKKGGRTVTGHPATAVASAFPPWNATVHVDFGRCPGLFPVQSAACRITLPDGHFFLCCTVSLRFMSAAGIRGAAMILLGRSG